MTFRKSLAIGILIGAASWWSAGTTRAEVPDVVVSIKPIHSLAAGLMQGIGEPVLLIEGGASPHAYSLRPSEAEALQNADVVFWIGDEMETFLEKPLEALPKQAKVVALHEADGVVLLPFREGGDWEAHADHEEHKEDHGHRDDHGHEHAEKHADEHDHGHEHAEKHGDEHDHGHAEDHAEHHDDDHAHGGHAHGENDMHIWLDPSNATAMVTRMVGVLSEVDPANAPRYQANGDALKTRLTALNSGIDGKLRPVKTTPYVVFHDAYQYFDKRYGLSPAGSITVDPDRKPSAQRLYSIRKKILDSGAVCVFSEPQFEPGVVTTVIEGTDARTALLDPLGADLPPGPDAYFVLLNNLATDLRSCLKPAS